MGFHVNGSQRYKAEGRIAHTNNDDDDEDNNNDRGDVYAFIHKLSRYARERADSFHECEREKRRAKDQASMKISTKLPCTNNNQKKTYGKTYTLRICVSNNTEQARDEP